MKKKWGFIYRRGKQLWFAYFDAADVRQFAPSGFQVGDQEKARELLRLIERKVRAERQFGVSSERAQVTVQSFASKWLDQRKALANYRTDELRMRLHILPQLGNLSLADVRPRHVIDAVREIQKAMAPRTLHNTYGLMRVMFRDAALEELIPSNPCMLTRKQLGKKEDKDPSGAPERSSRETSSRRSSRTRGYRSSVTRSTRWPVSLDCGWGRSRDCVGGHYDPTAEPLGRLVIAHSYEREGTKTGRSREVPVHPTLAGILADWKLRGWADLVGRHPAPDDFVAPTFRGGMRAERRSWKDLQTDLQALGYRGRRLPRILADVCHARPRRWRAEELLEIVTHSPRGNILDLYTSMPWPSLCEEVAKLKVARKMGQVIALPKVAQAGVITDRVTVVCNWRLSGRSYKWRRRESNPRPKVLHRWPPRASSAICSLARQVAPADGLPALAILGVLSLSSAQARKRASLNRYAQFPTPQAGHRADGFGLVFRQPERAQRCRWLLWFCRCIYEVTAPRHATMTSTPSSKPVRPQVFKELPPPIFVAQGPGSRRPRSDGSYRNS